MKNHHKLNLPKVVVDNFNDDDFRSGFLDEVVLTWVSHQIRVLREQRGLSQADLAKLCNTTQSVISRAEDPAYGKLNLKTLLRLRSAFDVGLQVRFVDAVKAAEEALMCEPMSVEVESYKTGDIQERHKNVTLSELGVREYTLEFHDSEGAVSYPRGNSTKVANADKHEFKLYDTA